MTEFRLGEVARVRTSIKPEDLRGTTLYVEPVGQPGKGFLVRVAEPMRVTDKGDEEAVIRDLTQELGLYSPREITVRWQTLILGGVEEGLLLSGMIEEICLRSSSRSEQN